MENFISVIIPVYKRKEFYKEAIESALNQTLDKKYYEIIVVHHIDIDKEYENVRYIKCDDLNIGAQLAIGIENARGNIISFLEDDDKFLPEKLQYVYETFKDEDIVYLHNDYISNNENFRNKNPDFNLSCISVRKDIINKNLNKITILPDTFMYCSALESKKKLIISDKKLTFYRLHENNISISKSLDDKIKLFLSYSNQYQKFFDFFKEKKVQRFLKIRITNFNIYLTLYGIDKEPVYLFTYLFSNYLSHRIRVKSTIAYILYKHNILKNYISKRIKNSADSK